MNKQQARELLISCGKFDGVAPIELWSSLKDEVRMSMGYCRYDIPVFIKGKGAASVSIDVSDDDGAKEAIFWVGQDPTKSIVPAKTFDDKVVEVVNTSIASGEIKAAFQENKSDKAALYKVVTDTNDIKQALVKLEEDGSLSLTII